MPDNRDRRRQVFVHNLAASMHHGSVTTGLSHREVVILDPAALVHIENNEPQKACGGASGAIYKTCNITQFDKKVVQRVKVEGDAAMGLYGEKKTVHIMHVASPSLDSGRPTAAVTQLCNAYKNVFVEHLNNDIVQLHLPPISSGVFKGYFEDTVFVEMTWKAIVLAFDGLTDAQQIKLGTQCIFVLCLFDRREYNLHFQEAQNTIKTCSKVKNGIFIEEHQNGLTVAVLQPGAGYYGCMSNAYKALEGAGHRVHLVGNTQTPQYKEYDNYPLGWTSCVHAPPTPQPRNLCSLAHIVYKEIQSLEPDVLICGSRGGQVTLHELWRLGFKKPTICLNAGVLHDRKKQIPAVPLVLVTFSADTFHTKNPETVCQALDSRQGDRITALWLCHVKDEGHRGENGKIVSDMTNIVQLAVGQGHASFSRNVTVHKVEKQCSLAGCRGWPAKGHWVAQCVHPAAKKMI